MDFAAPSSDIWSVGCLLYTMLTGNSLDDLAKLQQFSSQGQVSDACSSFLKSCLRSMEDRGDTEQLLQHPFVANSKEFGHSNLVKYYRSVV